MKKTSKLTFKQRAWLDKYLETKNATEAAMQVYDVKNRESAKVIGHENLTKLNFQELMEEAGVSDAKLLQKLNEGLDATKVVSARITGKDADSRTDDFIDVEDYPTRHKYLDTALKLKKKLDPKEKQKFNLTLIVNKLEDVIDGVLLGHEETKPQQIKSGN